MLLPSNDTGISVVSLIVKILSIQSNCADARIQLIFRDSVQGNMAKNLSPIGPALRANPCSEVTDPFCRLPLPTLFYRPEAIHLGDLLRISVRPSTRFTRRRSDFHVPTRALRTP
ncbi:hypothetical protein Tsp_03361 [Trichinella spiralis]|uniref:hypothetical protein n=4 Tax=Trichinella spiralis TaxID=6334 RepID=UPI0001EFCBAB|nr:hypothetical protein Tsp_03361 [Trichinella spiralis]